MKNALIVMILLLMTISIQAQETMAKVELTDLEKINTRLKETMAKNKVSNAIMLDHTQQAQFQLAEFAAEEIQYPEDFIESGLEGQIIVDLWINTQGKIIHTKIIDSFNTNFNPIVLRAFENFEFSGPQKIEYLGARRMRLPVDFSLE